MSNQKLNRNQRKAIRVHATVGTTIIPNHISIPKFPFSMFGARLEEEHLVYPRNVRISKRPFFQLNGLPNETTATICPLCGEDVLLEPFMANDARARMRVCHTCKTTRVSKCAKCGEETTQLELAMMRDGTTKAVCVECERNYFSYCKDCGMLCYDQTLVQINGKSRCPTCASAYKKKNYKCQNCGTWIPTEMKMQHPDSAGAYICPSCFAGVLQYNASLGKPKKVIFPYGKTDGSVFFSTEPGTERFYGVELEKQNGKYPEDQEDSLLQELWHFKECVLKRDASISYGYETVTFPLGLDYHIRHFNWKLYCEIHERYGFKAHEDPDAGMHIHVSRRAWGKTPATQKKRLPALVYLLDRQDWRKEWKKFSRRANKYVMEEIDNGDFSGGTDPFHYCRFYDVDWANRTLAEGYNEVVRVNRSYRNRILNFQSSPTVEWRMLKSTLVPNTIFANLEMYDVLVGISSGRWTESKLRAMRWEDLCRAIPGKYNHLVNYLKDQRLWRI